MIKKKCLKHLAHLSSNARQHNNCEAFLDVVIQTRVHSFIEHTCVKGLGWANEGDSGIQGQVVHTAQSNSIMEYRKWIISRQEVLYYDIYPGCCEREKAQVLSFRFGNVPRRRDLQKSLERPNQAQGSKLRQHPGSGSQQQRGQMIAPESFWETQGALWACPAESSLQCPKSSVVLRQQSKTWVQIPPLPVISSCKKPSPTLDPDPSLPTYWCDHSRVFPPLNSESRILVTN